MDGLRGKKEHARERKSRRGGGQRAGGGEVAPVSVLASIAKAQLLFLAVGLGLTLIFCLIAHRLADPAAVTTPLSLLALALAAIVSGIGAVRWTGDGLVSGLLSGGVTMGLVWAISLLPMPDAPLEVGDRVLFYCLIPVLALCGAVLGKKRRRSARTHRR